MIDITFLNTLNVKHGKYDGTYGGTQVVFPLSDMQKLPVLQYQVTLAGPGVRGVYAVEVTVYDEFITIREAKDEFYRDMVDEPKSDRADTVPEPPTELRNATPTEREVDYGK